MFAPHGKRLAWWATRDKINLFRKGTEIETTNIAFMEGPVSDQWIVALLVLADGVASPAIPFNDGQGLKSRKTDPHAKSPGT